MLKSRFLLNYKVQAMFTTILIPDINTRELENNINPTSKKLIFLPFLLLFLVRTKSLEKWEKKIYHEPVHVG